MSVDDRGQPAGADPYLWLEGVTDPAALAWVAERNAAVDRELAGGTRFAELRDEIKAALDSTERVAYPLMVGGWLENFWQDADHPRGLWRRTTPAGYRKPEPDWEVLLDIDELGRREGESWVWHGAQWLRPAYDRALVCLSPGGSDAHVLREFDVARREFVADGFALPAAKSWARWIDRDTVLVGTDTGAGSLTGSGYPRQVRRWRRGTPVTDAPVVFEGRVEDVSVSAGHDTTGSRPRTLVTRYPDFFSARHFLLAGDGTLTPVPVPADAEVDVHRDWLLVRIRSDWATGGARHPAGSLLVADIDPFVADPAGSPLTAVYSPGPDTALLDHAWTSDHLLLSTLDNVRGRIDLCVPSAGWARRPVLDGGDDFATVSIHDTDRYTGDAFLLLRDGFAQPATLLSGTPDAPLEVLREEPNFFDPTDIEVRQHIAVSADGTPVPYFVTGRAGGTGPALLSGYGGFEISRLPHYDAILGRAWLARGGRYILANIRGGGEFGPAWHHAAMREKRLRAYEDMAAVAQDVVRRGIVDTPGRLGFEGRSNGGLLAGVMLTRYPDLFGAVVSQVPLLDMRRYHLLLAGASWMAEYGDPDNADDWDFLAAYSPYHNVHSGRSYPPALFATSTRDDRVHPGHARKMVARMLAQGHDVRYYENVEGGHGGAADSAQHAYRWALLFEFLWRRLG